jgi:hypothetical protein
MKRSCLILLVAAFVGCGGGDPKAPKVAPVAGVINYKGAAVADATVVFYPDKGPAATGKTDSKGAFQVRTNGQLGTSVGKNKVTVVAAQQQGEIPPADGNEMKLLEKQNAIPKKYNQQDTTDLVVDIPAAGNKELVLDLTD